MKLQESQMSVELRHVTGKVLLFPVQSLVAAQQSPRVEFLATRVFVHQESTRLALLLPYELYEGSVSTSLR